MRQSVQQGEAIEAKGGAEAGGAELGARQRVTAPRSASSEGSTLRGEEERKWIMSV